MVYHIHSWPDGNSKVNRVRETGRYGPCHLKRNAINSSPDPVGLFIEG